MLVLDHLNGCAAAGELPDFHRRPTRGTRLDDIHSSVDTLLNNAGFLAKALLEDIGLVAIAILNDRCLQVTARLQDPDLIANAALNSRGTVAYSLLHG